MLSVALSTVAIAAPPPGSTAPAQSQTPPPAVPPPDDSLFEFLGSDDVGDARWWDYLMKSAPRAQSPPPPPAPAQDANK
ncbi:MAG: hypothetical protein ACHQIL_05035 [Steroidobacterales bacterium]